MVPHSHLHCQIRPLFFVFLSDKDNTVQRPNFCPVKSCLQLHSLTPFYNACADFTIYFLHLLH
jgi:hypothetical protein